MIKKRWILAALLAATLLPARAQVDGQEQKDTPRWSLSSNLLSWATLAPNLGAEVYLGSRLSLAVDGSFGMWGFGTDKTGSPASTHEVVARMLKRFSADGLVELRRGAVRLKNPEALRKI